VGDKGNRWLDITTEQIVCSSDKRTNVYNALLFPLLILGEQDLGGACILHEMLIARYARAQW
jgi:malic enzyme